MTTDIPAGATPQDVPTVTVTQPQGTPQGATPQPPIDTAARIAALERDLESANSRITVLNGESATKRREADAANTKLIAKETEFAEREKAIEVLLKRGKDVSEINAFLDERETLLTEKQQSAAAAARDSILTEVSKHAGASKEALAQLDRAGINYDFKDRAGSKTGEKDVFVKVVDGAGKETLQPFDDFWKVFLPSLRPQSAPRYGASPAPVAGNNQEAPVVQRRTSFL